MKQPVAGAGVQGCGPPKLASAVKPTLGYVVAKLTSAVLIVRSEPAAEDSLADILARIKFGMAMAAMIRMIATTISNSIREKPFCFFMNPPSEILWCQSTRLLVHSGCQWLRSC